MNRLNTITREQIISMIPHGAAMCMLDRVVSWNNSQIVCESVRLIEPTNPLCEQGKLPSILLVEYAAQASAVHAALLNSGMGKARPAYIGAIKNIQLFAAEVNSNMPLTITADCALHSDTGAIYEFFVSQSDKKLICGKLILSQPMS